MKSEKREAGWTCPICGRWEDGTGPCAHTRPREDATVSWLREDLKRAGEQLKRYEADRPERAR